MQKARKDFGWAFFFKFSGCMQVTTSLIHPTSIQPLLHSPLGTTHLVAKYTHSHAQMDRSAEFFNTVESLRSRAQPHLSSDKRRLLSPIEQQQSAGLPHAGRQKSEFAVMASLIGKDIHSTAGKLQKLARCKWDPDYFCSKKKN